MAETLNPTAVLRLYRRGYSDQAVARRLGCSRDAARRWRLRAGLPHNGDSPHTRRLKSKGQRRRLAREGLGVGHVFRARMCLESWRAGWSHPLTALERIACEALLHGAATQREIATRAGRPDLVWSHALLRALKRLGAQRLVSAEPGSGRFAARVYSLAPAVTKRGQVSA